MTLTAVVPTRTFAYADRLLASMERSEPGSAARAVLVDTGMDERAQINPVRRGDLEIVEHESGNSVALYGDSVDTRGYLRHMYDCQIIEDKVQPFVYARAINMGARAAPPRSHLLLLNDDTEILTKEWHTRLDQLIRVTADIEFDGRAMGLLSCAIAPGGVGNLQQEYVAPGFNEAGLPARASEVREIIGTVCFVACAIPARVWAGVTGGTEVYSIGLDERFIMGNFEDDDYTRRVRKTGYNCYVTDAVVVRHIGYQGMGMHGTSLPMFGAERLREIFFQNKARYDAKWAGQG